MFAVVTLVPRHLAPPCLLSSWCSCYVANVNKKHKMELVNHLFSPLRCFFFPCSLAPSLPQFSKSRSPILEILQGPIPKGAAGLFPGREDFPGPLEDPQGGRRAGHGGAWPPGVALVPEPEGSRVALDRENPRQFLSKDAFYDYVNIPA